jgi:N-acetylmuramoyl-L-alanine amidase
MSNRSDPARTIFAVFAILILGATFFFDGQNTSRAGDPAPDRSHSSNSGGARPVDLKPDINERFIPFGAKRKHQMARYSKRHYGKAEWRLEEPKQIVEHYAVASTLGKIYNTFRPDNPDVEFHELPNVCAHFAVDGKGRVQQFVRLGIRCRHVVGLNDVTIGIEHTGFSDRQVLSDKKQMRSSLKLTKWLRCRYGIAVKDVIGHNESLSSRFHHERVKSLRHQTHGDFKRRSMRHYRKQLRALGTC